MNPGIYKISDNDYHADPAPEPSLSASIANILLAESPLHAWHAHPRLNKAWRPRAATNEMDFGSACHALLLEGNDSSIVKVDAKDWRTNEAKDRRLAARSMGKIALTVADYAQAKEVVQSAREQLAGSEIASAMQSGRPEQTLLWQEGGVWCRGKADWLTESRELVLDYKTTSQSAEPTAYLRQLLNLGADIQCAMYGRGVRALTGKMPAFVFACQEFDPPYALSLVGMDPAWIAWADAKLDLAVKTWKRCLASNEWPGYSNRIVWGSLPAWAEAQWEERKLMAEE